MAFTYSFGADPTIGFDETSSLLANIYGGTLLTTTPTIYEVEDGGRTFTFSGTGFTFITIGGHTLLSGGTIDTISVSQGGINLGTMSNLGISGADLTTAFLDEAFSFDPVALENLFFTPDWIFYGTSGAENLTDADLTPDGVPYAPSGNDTAYLYGGNDVFALGLGNDTAFGGTGDDYLYGGAGDDILDGGSQRDRLYGGDDSDILYGGNNADFLYGGDGDDFIYGGTSSDIMVGGAGNDAMYGGGKKDKLYGQDGDDVMYGGWSSDRLYGQNDNDDLYGGDSNDRLYGGEGNDALYGGTSVDLMYGGNGDDTLDGGSGTDYLYGGAGEDTFVFDDQSGNDQVFGFELGTDSIDIENTAFLSIGIFADQVTISHSGGTVTLNDLSISNISEYNTLLASVDADFGIV